MKKIRTGDRQSLVVKRTASVLALAVLSILVMMLFGQTSAVAAPTSSGLEIRIGGEIGRASCRERV